MTFSNDVRKVVMKYVVVPVLVAYFVILAIIVLFYGLSISYSAKAECHSAASRFESVVSSYEKRLSSIVEDRSLERLIAGEIYGNAFSERVYDFINEQDIPAHFFLLDAHGSLVIGSSTILSNYLLSKPPYNTGFMYRLHNNLPDYRQFYDQRNFTLIDYASNVAKQYRKEDIDVFEQEIEVHALHPYMMKSKLLDRP